MFPANGATSDVSDNDTALFEMDSDADEVDVPPCPASTMESVPAIQSRVRDDFVTDSRYEYTPTPSVVVFASVNDNDTVPVDAAVVKSVATTVPDESMMSVANVAPVATHGEPDSVTVNDSVKSLPTVATRFNVAGSAEYVAI